MQRVAPLSRKATALMIVCGAILLLGSPAAGASWPVVQPTQELFSIQDPDNAFVRTFVRDRQGNPLYLFICRSREDASVPDVIYVSDLDCRLIPASYGEVEYNLLVEEPKEKAWFSRGRMFAEQLYGDCASYPEYGAVRHFRLRGMKLTMRFSDVKFAAAPPTLEGPPSARLTSYKLQLTIERDPSANRKIAAPSGYLDPLRVGQMPPRSCSKVQRGIDR